MWAGRERLIVLALRSQPLSFHTFLGHHRHYVTAPIWWHKKWIGKINSWAQDLQSIFLFIHSWPIVLYLLCVGHEMKRRREIDKVLVAALHFVWLGQPACPKDWTLSTAARTLRLSPHKDKDKRTSPTHINGPITSLFFLILFFYRWAHKYVRANSSLSLYFSLSFLYWILPIYPFLSFIIWQDSTKK